MMRFVNKPEYFWPLVWSVTSLVLVGVLVFELEFGRSTAGEGPRGPARVAEARLLPAFRLTPETLAGAQTLQRPLFVPGRRPAPAGDGGSSGVIKKGQLVLQGTTLDGALSIAMLKEISTGMVHRVEKGGDILGMTLAEVSAEQVVLKAGDDSETLPLLVATGTGNAAAAIERGPFGSPGGPAPVASPPAGAAVQTLPGALTAPGPARGAEPRAAPVNPRVASPGSAAMTPEEIIARRREARSPLPRN